MLQRLLAERAFRPTRAANAIAAAAEGYSFPTNLDRDPPIGGLAPQTQAQLMGQALAEGWSPDAFAKAVDEHAARRLTSGIANNNQGDLRREILCRHYNFLAALVRAMLHSVS